MTLRQRYAGQIAAGLVNHTGPVALEEIYRRIAQQAFGVADALIAHEEKNEPGTLSGLEKALEIIETTGYTTAENSYAMCMRIRERIQAEIAKRK